MKELTTSKKGQVVKLLLAGLSYDEIAQQAGVAKGSVVNIVDEFRDGKLSLPPGMTEYIDELRHLVVDMKKHSTTVPQLKTYLKIHAKLQEMGIDNKQVEHWLDICQDITTSTVSNSQFVQAGLQLAQFTAENDCDYKSLIDDYQAKLDKVKVLEAQIEQETNQLSGIKQESKEEREQATKELNSITSAVATAQDIFEKQKESLKSQLDEYLAQNKLSWKKVSTVAAILNTELGNASLNQEEIDEVSRQIAAIGSLVVLIKQLEQKRDELQPQVDQLAEEKKVFSSHLEQLKHENVKAFNSLSEREQEEGELDARLEAKRAKLAELEQIVSGYIHDIRNAWAIIGFLASPEDVNNADFDEFVGLMVYLRQSRLGIGPQQIKDGNGKVICECKVPKAYIDLGKYGKDVEEARRRLALLLVPLVKDKFMPRWEYDSAQLAQLANSFQELQFKLHELS